MVALNESCRNCRFSKMTDINGMMMLVCWQDAMDGSKQTGEQFHLWIVANDYHCEKYDSVDDGFADV